MDHPKEHRTYRNPIKDIIKKYQQTAGDSIRGPPKTTLKSLLDSKHEDKNLFSSETSSITNTELEYSSSKSHTALLSSKVQREGFSETPNPSTLAASGSLSIKDSRCGFQPIKTEPVLQLNENSGVKSESSDVQSTFKFGSTSLAGVVPVSTLIGLGLQEEDSNFKGTNNYCLANFRGHEIPGFNIGGEERLCLPPLLMKLHFLASISSDGVESLTNKLNIKLFQCNRLQIEKLQSTRAIPRTVFHASLIRRSDAERLCNAVLETDVRKGQNVPDNLPDHNIFRVYHKCFGKNSGIFYADLYRHLHSLCIQCLTCYVMFSPDTFVGHTHHSSENNVCHWGFNSSKWQKYLYLYKTDECKKDEFVAVKARFEKVPASLKRKELFVESSELSHKRVKQEDSQLNTPSYKSIPVENTYRRMSGESSSVVTFDKAPRLVNQDSSQRNKPGSNSRFYAPNISLQPADGKLVDESTSHPSHKLGVLGVSVDEAEQLSSPGGGSGGVTPHSTTPLSLVGECSDLRRTCTDLTQQLQEAKQRLSSLEANSAEQGKQKEMLSRVFLATLSERNELLLSCVQYSNYLEELLNSHGITYRKNELASTVSALLRGDRAVVARSTHCSQHNNQQRNSQQQAITVLQQVMQLKGV